ncbi:MAG TPA: glycoside hydrolase family 5 protein, partial [Candidatus Methylacidiphilales bacterium]
MKIPALVVALACSLATMTAQTGPTLPSPGINFGNMLEAPKEGAWGLTLKDEYFGIAAKAGFKTIRIPIRWSVRTSPKPPYAIDPAFLARVDRAVAGAKREGLTAILDLHNYTELEENPDANAARFIAIWKQIAEHYRDEPPSIVFELCNEPSKKLDAGRWNILIAGTLAAIRPSNPDRTVIVGPVGWNSIGKLPDLVLPENDRNLLVTVHYYDPFHFTHQKASWVEGSDAWAGTRWTGTDAEKAAVAADFAKAAAWGKEHGRP